MIVDFDIDKWIEQNIPWLMRKPKMLALVKVCAAPFLVIYQDFLDNRKFNLIKANYNSQVFSLEDFLNTKYDPEERRITIDDGFATQRIYFYLPEENKPVYFDPPVYFFLPGEYADSGIDFIVNTHNAIVLTDTIKNEIKVWINYFKLASKRYTIQ
ncbi:MAG: hypothetical protein DI598_13850 [Pseudopedobacter saltans]|uniref:Uncharacterized protein n=1 Tax=Pseudopedobacter saltans TaxID=151895 RepID=A0A2W5ELT3_9SPHI|nr:MAG: hypothetical protein DI598_13850 [Pseudopedobacter saltans]